MMRTDELSGSSWQSFLLELFFFKFLFVYYVKSTNAAKNYFHLEKACLKLLLEYCPWQILIKRATWIFNPIKKNHCFNLPLPRFSPEVFPLKPHWIQTVPRNQRNKKNYSKTNIVSLTRFSMELRAGKVYQELRPGADKTF